MIHRGRTSRPTASPDASPEWGRRPARPCLPGLVRRRPGASRDPAPAPKDYIAASGGIFRDMTIHDLDMARFFIPEIVEVSAVGANVFSDDIRELNDFDSATITLRGNNGELSHHRQLPALRVRLRPTPRSVRHRRDVIAGNATKTLVRRYDASGTEEAPPYLPFFLERYAQAYRAELDAFAHSIRTGEPCSPSFEDGVAALVLANAAAESAITGKTVAITS